MTENEADLKEAQELYYSLGGMPSQSMTPRKAPWYWRRAAKMLRDLREAEAAKPRRTMPRPRSTSTHTYAYLDVDLATFADVRTRLEAVDYGHTFGEDGGQRIIDMHGIALREPATEEEAGE